MFSIACILLASLCVVDSSTVMRCSVNTTFNFVEDQTPGITCSGFPVGYWSLTGPSTGRQEIRIGDCSKCGSGGACLCITHSTDYIITRHGDGSTLFFVDNLSGNNRSTITCSSENNNTCVTSTINIIKVAAYRVPACNNTVAFYENSKRRIRCEGMELSQDMYWSITYPNMTEHTVAVCGNCENGPCPQCDVNIDDFSVERNQTFSVLRMTAGNDRDKDGAVVKCSKLNNATNDQCQLSVQYYTLPQCTEGRVYVSETEPWIHITCDGVKSNHKMNWTLTGDSGQVTTIAECYGNGTCTTKNDDVTVSQNNSTSTLTFVNNVMQKDNHTLTCVRRNGETKASCLIRTFRKPGTTLTTTCPNYVLEGSDLTCECSHLTAQHGNPPATISWRDVTDTAFLHVNNVSSLLHVPTVHRNQNGTQFVCTSVWGAGTEVVNSTYIYTLLVAYNDPEPFPWVVVVVAVSATVLVIIIVIAIVVVVRRRRAHRKGAVENKAEDNASDDEFEEHINDLYQSSDLDTPPLPDQCTPASAAQQQQQAFPRQPLQASSALRGSNTESADPNGIQEVTKTAQPDGVYNVLGSTPRGDQKADAVYNHLTKL